MEDYYAILGLDSGASQESIKLAYRRLARQSHPDRNIDSNEAERGALSLQMAHLNAAYSVLSDPARRREYDEKIRIMDTLTGHGSSRVANTVTVTKQVTVTKSATKSTGGYKVHIPREDSSMRELSNQIRCTLQANSKGFDWKQTSLEGFDWGLECTSWTTHYCVAGRGFGLLDPPAAKKFANYLEVVVSRFNRSVRKSHFLFLLPFQQLSQWESVSAEFNKILSPQDHAKKLDAPVGIVLFDSQKGRTLRVGSLMKDKNFEDLLLCLGSVVTSPRSSAS